MPGLLKKNTYGLEEGWNKFATTLTEADLGSVVVLLQKEFDDQTYSEYILLQSAPGRYHAPEIRGFISEYNVRKTTRHFIENAMKLLVEMLDNLVKSENKPEWTAKRAKEFMGSTGKECLCSLAGDFNPLLPER